MKGDNGGRGRRGGVKAAVRVVIPTGKAPSSREENGKKRENDKNADTMEGTEWERQGTA